MKTFKDIYKENDYFHPAEMYFLAFNYDGYWPSYFLTGVRIYSANTYVKWHWARNSDEEWISLESSHYGNCPPSNNRFGSLDLRNCNIKAGETSHIVYGKNLHIFADKEALKCWIEEKKEEIQNKIESLNKQIEVFDKLFINADDNYTIKENTDEFSAIKSWVYKEIV